MLGSNELRKNTVFLQDGFAWKVLDFKHIKMGRGPATIRVKVINLKTQSITEKTLSNEEKVVEADVAKRTAQYLYADDKDVHFMDSEDYSQFSFTRDEIGSDMGYMLEGQKVIVLFLDAKPVSIEMPKSVELEVVSAPDAVSGDTATNASKKVVLSTGLEIPAPLFIKVGERIKVNTETGEYTGRA